MFTGIIQTIGQLENLEPMGGDVRLTIDISKADFETPQLGASVAVNGVCLTATTLDSQRFVADVSNETLALTTLGNLAIGDGVNLEPALKVGDALGGHWVSGHVDGRCPLVGKQQEGRSWRLKFVAPKALAGFIAPKGSVCLDGISLTVNEVEGEHFGVNIVPHTFERTVLGEREIGDELNLEVDIVARYLARMNRYNAD